jgi:hypothetical protein
MVGASFLMLSVAAPVPVCSWTPEEPKVESSEHQDNANIHYQPFPVSVSEEHEIYTDYDGDHRHHVKHDSYLSAHFSLPVTSDATTDLGLGICPCPIFSIFICMGR